MPTLIHQTIAMRLVGGEIGGEPKVFLERKNGKDRMDTDIWEDMPADIQSQYIPGVLVQYLDDPKAASAAAAIQTVIDALTAWKTHIQGLP